MFRRIKRVVLARFDRVVPELWGRHDNGRHTEFWRDLSWMVGDEHADRMCRILDLYSVVFEIPKANARARPPAVASYYARN